jgi:WD40 repeat protein
MKMKLLIVAVATLLMESSAGPAEVLKERATLNAEEELLCMAITPGGKTLATGGWEKISFWDPSTGEQLRALEGHARAVGCLAFSPTHKLLASGSPDRTFKLWEVATGKERATLRPGTGAKPREMRIHAVGFTPNGKTLALGMMDGTVRPWNVRLGQEERPRVVKELVAADWRRPGDKLLRITGKVKVVDAGTLVFEDGTEVQASGVTETPPLEQKGLIGESFYPLGKEAAGFLEKLIGDRAVSFYAFGTGSDRAGKTLRGRCFVGETNLGIEMVRNGWALSHHSQMTPYEIIAREKKRGLWRGKFVAPDRWRKGERLPGESAESAAERSALEALGVFEPIITRDDTRPGKPVVAIQLRPNLERKVRDGDLAHLTKLSCLRSVDLSSQNITDAGLEHVEGLSQLKGLNLRGTRVTKEGVDRLKKRLPQIKCGFGPAPR